jgi:hypothetical protein
MGQSVIIICCRRIHGHLTAGFSEVDRYDSGSFISSRSALYRASPCSLRRILVGLHPRGVGVSLLVSAFVSLECQALNLARHAGDEPRRDPPVLGDQLIDNLP